MCVYANLEREDFDGHLRNFVCLLHFLFVLRKFLEMTLNSWNFEKCAILSDLLKASLLLTVRQ